MFVCVLLVICLSVCSTSCKVPIDKEIPGISSKDLAYFILSDPCVGDDIESINDYFGDSDISFLINSLKKFAVSIEILDEREAKYYFTNSNSLASDFLTLRVRFRELKDAPYLSDSYRFPNRDVVASYLAFNRAYLHYLELSQSFSANKQWYSDAIEETNYLYRIWDYVRDSSAEYNYVSNRRRALMNLREAIGVKNYYSGILPPYVPLWRFKQLD